MFALRFICRRVISLSTKYTFSTRAGDVFNDRRKALARIYGPFFDKIEKDSDEYTKLAKSGKVWEDYFQPWNSERLGYTAMQDESLAHRFRLLN